MRPMAPRPGDQGLVISTLLMAALAAGLFAYVTWRGEGRALAGAQTGLAQFARVLPLVVCAFLCIGLLPQALPRDWVVRWLGDQTGWRGLLLGTVAGAIAPGGPLIQASLAGGLVQAGAGIGVIVAFLAAGVLWNLPLLPLEAAFLGWRFVFINLAATFSVPPLAGWLAQGIARLW